MVNRRCCSRSRLYSSLFSSGLGYAKPKLAKRMIPSFALRKSTQPTKTLTGGPFTLCFLPTHRCEVPMKKTAIAVVACLALAISAFPSSRNSSSHHSAAATTAHHHVSTTSTQHHNYYTNSSGHRVHTPIHARSAPAGATAQCGDGSYSFSEHRHGTCSHHGGVSTWMVH